MWIQYSISMLALPLVGAVKTVIFPGFSQNKSSYGLLEKDFSAIASTAVDHTFCIAHSAEGFARMLDANIDICNKGSAVYGYVPTESQLRNMKTPLLVTVSVADEISPFSHFATARHNSKNLPHMFVALKDFGHYSILDSKEYLSSTESVPIAPNSAFREEFVSIVASYMDLDTRDYLDAALRTTAALADPIVKALQLEGSAALGEPQCNSDFPTNPSCQYPIYPGHSLPPGPEPAPDPPLSENCVCGSPWVMTVGSTMSADMASSPRPSTTLITNDAFHNVSDTHPFHLPNIFNECSSDLNEPCELNLTTVSMAILKAGDLFPSDEAVSSAFELRTKFKSRQATWERAGFGSGTDELDQGTNVCRDINQRAYDWALENAEPSVRETFEKYGEPYVMVDDVEAPIGDHGPTWIDEELIYTRVVDESTGKSRIEIQSWSFVVANVKDGDVPWFIAVGMHYCKLLSPARAMEWIYSEGVRRALPPLLVSN